MEQADKKVLVIFTGILTKFHNVLHFPFYCSTLRLTSQISVLQKSLKKED